MASVEGSIFVAEAAMGFVSRHKKGFAIGAAGLGVASLLAYRSVALDDTPKVSVEPKVVVEPPNVEIHKIEGIAVGCFVKQSTGVDLTAHDERNVNVHIPIPFTDGLDPLKGKTIEDNVTHKHIEGETRLCADQNHTNAQTTFETVRDVETGQQRKIPKHLDVTISAPDLEVVGGIIPQPTSKTSLDPSWLNRTMPFVRYDNGNITGFLDVVGFHLMKDYACNQDALRVAQVSLQQIFEKYGQDIGGIPRNEVTTHITGIPSANGNWTEGRIDDNDNFSRQLGIEGDQLQRLGFGSSVSADIKLDVGRTSCGAVAVDATGRYLPTSVN